MNCTLRISLLQSLNPDIISLNETHLRQDDKIDFEGYSWFGHNRTLHKRAKKASGGVGIVVKIHLLDYFRIQVVDKSMDDKIGVRLEHRELQYSLVIFSCYLPPEGSTRGRDSVTFLLICWPRFTPWKLMSFIYVETLTVVFQIKMTVLGILIMSHLEWP